MVGRRHLHIDCASGVAGDMLLASCLDYGLECDALSAMLSALPVPAFQKDAFRLQGKKVNKAGVMATRLIVDLPDEAHHRHWSDIRTMISSSRLSANVKDNALEVFHLLAQAESKVHGVAVDDVHFHEVGALDSILDIVGVAWAFEELGLSASQLTCSAVNLGSGRVKTAHGFLPVPAPATALLAEGIAVYGSYSGPHLSLSDHRQSMDQAAIAAKGGDGELATPTGLALLRHYCRSFGPMAPMTIQGQAFGAGKKDFDHPNVVRFLFGDLAPSCFHDMSGAGVEPVDASGLKQDRIVELEANIDDLSAELTAPLMQALLDIGALDVFFTPIMMKKGRLAQKLSILCQPGQEMEIVCHVMRHTTTLGVRRVSKERFKLDRCFEALSTPYGSVTIKLGYLGKELVTCSPEFEDCQALALQHTIPVHIIYRAACALADERWRQ